MDKVRALLVGFAQVTMIAVMVIGPIVGFVLAGNSTRMLYGSFSVALGLVGAFVGFAMSGVGMSVLAILLDIRLTLLRIQAKGTL